MLNAINHTDLDADVVSKYLQGSMTGFGRVHKISRFKNGQSNPTYLLETDSLKYVLRRKPYGKLLRSAHAIDREYRVMKALASSDVPVPRMLHLCEDDTVIGSMFYIMEFVEGRTLWDQTLPTFKAEERTKVFDEMNRVLAAVHNVNLAAAGLEDYGKPGNYFARQTERWSKQYRAAQTDKVEEIDTVIKWLNGNLPEDDGQVTLVHGDYRMDNLIFSQKEIKAASLLDWELSTLGHPLSDLAYQCAQWRLPPGKLTRGLAGIDRQAFGIPSEEEYIEAYCSRRGQTKIDNWTFAIVFTLFRLTSILQGVKKRDLQGNASNPQANALAAFVEPLAQLCCQIIETET